ncbi:Pre-tRNA-processing protein PTA1 [Candida viswanathii]|uniref:Pre-tRNA-processing protein PTA1 n=1 Tax=Candida viswanathii TaxID=5486 RepID=A0A367YIN5_9ASCO|nr:Pre-tRNA-processing protein PTA1 [Candida viswanathii]
MFTPQDTLLTQNVARLETMKEVAKKNPQQYSRTLRDLLSIVINQPKETEQHKWIVGFLHETFINNEQIDIRSKHEYAIESLDGLTALTNIRDVATFRKVIDISCVVFRVVFQYVAQNSNSGVVQIWSKLIELKNKLVNKYVTTFPLDASDNVEHDLVRNIPTKLELLKFLMVVIDITTRTDTIGAPIRNVSDQFCLNHVSPSHAVIKHKQMENEAQQIFVGLVLKVFDNEIIIPQLITATLNHCIVIMKKKPQLVKMLLNKINKYDTTLKLQSNYQSVEEFKLARRYVDKNIRIFIQHCLKQKLVPQEFRIPLETQANVLADRWYDIKKKSVFEIGDQNIRKRKFDGFMNPSRRLKERNYASLYNLIGLRNEINNYDLSPAPQPVLARLISNALQRASIPKLTKALDIISDRYKYAWENTPKQEQEEETTKKRKLEQDGTPQPQLQPLRKQARSATPDVRPKQEEEDEEDEIDEEDELNYGGEVGDDFFNPDEVFLLPPPTDVAFLERKLNLKVIISNFIHLANKGPGDSPEYAELSAENKHNLKYALPHLAFKAWKKGSWVVLLTRLASRGMRIRHYDNPDGTNSPDEIHKQEMADMIREEILKYCSASVNSRIDIIIEWLSEEWYSERVFQQDEFIKQGKNPDKETITTPIYDKWSAKVFDAIINYIEPQAAKLFIRLVSDLPDLNDNVIGKIKSLCFDPVKSNIGFLALQFLLTYRPPVKESCIRVLKELAESDQEDTKAEAKKKLAKLEKN